MSENYSSDADYLMDRIADQHKLIEQALTNGGAKDHAEYRQLCGQLRGLEFVENLITDLAKRHEDADD